MLRAASGARVVILSSIVADFVSKLNWEAFEDTPARRKLGPQGLYAQSKVFSVIIAREFARRYPDSGIVFSSLNPGTYPIKASDPGHERAQVTSDLTYNGTCLGSNALQLYGQHATFSFTFVLMFSHRRTRCFSMFPMERSHLFMLLRRPTQPQMAQYVLKPLEILELLTCVVLHPMGTTRKYPEGCLG